MREEYTVSNPIVKMDAEIPNAGKTPVPFTNQVNFHYHRAAPC